MELETKQKVVVVLVLVALSVVGLVLAFMFIFLDLFVPSRPAFTFTDTLGPVVDRLNAVAPKLNELAPQLEALLPRFQALVAKAQDYIPEDLNTLANYFVSQIPGAGVVNEGPLKPFDVGKCLTGEVDNCFFQNPATPYTRFAWKNELPGLLGTLDVIPFTSSDVIVIKGITPPPCVYWSFIPYLLQGTKICSGSQVAAGLSDAVSNITTGWAPQTPFTIIMGANSSAIAAVQAKLPADAAVQVVTQQFAYVGPGLYWIIGRTALFDSTEDQVSYLANPQISAVIVRLPQDAFDATQTLTTPTYRPRNLAIDEYTVVGEQVYSDNAEAYLQSVLETLGGTYTAQDVPVVQYPLVNSGTYDSGASCIASCSNCYIDNRDTLYVAGEVQDLAPGHYLLVYAVNHSAYKKAIYAQVSIYDNSKALGLDAVNALPSDGDFYTVLVTQRTDAPTSVPAGTQTLTIEDTVTDVTIAERAYVQPTDRSNPSFGASADLSTILPMKVWLLSP